MSSKQKGEKIQGKHSKSFAKVYWPYLPAILLILWGFYAPRINLVHDEKKGVLAYATNTSTDGLLDATNNQRRTVGAGALTINSKLVSAAQAKANDMAARNYWSHNTPEGNAPWVFIKSAGYSYNKVGENLAYGFITSDDTITGWMNSPSHKANMLDMQYKEVGFGIAYNANYQDNGETTIVVAVYGDPYVLQVAPSSTTDQTTISDTVASQQSAQQLTVKSASSQKVAKHAPYTSASTKTPTKDVLVSRIQSLTNGDAPWLNFALTLVVFGGLTFYFVKHAWAIKKVLIEGEEFIIKHPIIDIEIIALVSLAIYSLAQSGRVL